MKTSSAIGGSVESTKDKYASPRPLSAARSQALPQDIRLILAITQQKRTPQQATKLSNYYRTMVEPSVVEAKKQLKAAQAEKAALIKKALDKSIGKAPVES